MQQHACTAASCEAISSSHPAPQPRIRTHRRSTLIARAQGTDAPPTPADTMARRALLQGVLVASAASTLQAPAAHALEFSELINQAFPPPPQLVFFPRKALDLRFAVLLMRAGYDAVDALDYIPMDKFQIAFWKQRQSEQEAYALQYSPLKVQQGDLTSPLYFDYISFSQFMVIGREMPRGQQVFQEFCETCEQGETKLVRRDPALSDNALLPAAFNNIVGDNVYTGLRDGFRGEVFGAPQPVPASAPLSELVSKVQNILDIMVDRGYALKAEVCDVTPLGFKVRVQGPANLWALSSLAFRRSPVLNTYDALTVAAYVRASGRTLTQPPQTLVSDAGTETTFQLVA